MDNLADILASKDFDKPRETKIIEDYARREFNEAVEVKVLEREIIVLVRSSACANALRLRTLALRKLLGKDDNRRLIFRISN